MRFQHALAAQETYFSLLVEPLTFYKNVAPSKELRDASNEADALLRDYTVDASLRVDVFNAKVAAEKNIKASGKVLTSEEQRLVDKMILEGKRDGLALPESEREELKKLQKALSQTCLEFSVSLTLLSSRSSVDSLYRKTTTRKMASSASRRKNSRASLLMSCLDILNALLKVRRMSMTSPSRLQIFFPSSNTLKTQTFGDELSSPMNLVSTLTFHTLPKCSTFAAKLQHCSDIRPGQITGPKSRW